MTCNLYIFYINTIPWPTFFPEWTSNLLLHLLRFQNDIEKTKILNDTAVEYIQGIKVIKDFGKSKSSYEKFVKAAKEGSDCYVEWMRDSSGPLQLPL